ncbi:MAG: 16S rRNA processing protein RimM [Clostridia bacterium]|nr:16S rRNA processing protein RimM [Clostridia bacterium]
MSINVDFNEIKKTHLECGKIINTHGIKGTVKAESWCDSPEILADLERVFIFENGKLKKYRVVDASVFKKFVLFDLEGVTTPEAAEALREKILYLSREDIELEEGDFFIADLIGLPVIDVNSGVEYGTLSDVINAGASDIYVIKTSNGETMMPAVNEFVKNVDLEKGIFVEPIEGMF